MRRDIELTQWIEHLGFDELWMGEHHSGGMQVYGSPDLFIAAAAERTARIKLGVGVYSVPYHHPYMVADRIVQLDHQTRGRSMVGFGPGMLVSDAMMLGIAPDQQRARLVEGVDIIMRLIAGETITHDSDGWFKLRDASLQLSPYSYPRPHMVIAASRTPTGARMAGRYGFGILTPGAGDVNGTWAIAEESAKEYGTTLDRNNLRCLVNFHLAETKADALKAVEFGLEPWMHYLDALNPKAYEDTRAKAGADPAKIVAARGGLVGTPDEAVTFLEKLWEKTGPFGTVLMGGTNWMPFEATKRSYELMARYVMPKFNRANVQRDNSLAWVHSNRHEFSGASQAAVDKANASKGRV
jgi:limonene 1,2-monooxygenase